ncbi:Malignant T-cell-amplified sequence 1 [Strongyloides ratti]|uniref:Malignant T-cell-amplified sequence 1 n=1 Tax=Strongyloides ratti TaxID=34506 RepID=A0A090LC31_STRRB|nr:Malignant T-cell-amplified sequence 1 [Strongyloides ratti]CEF65090.1 Malignant T-cell-amplified sequence 1 [Strongyloides ratti]
MFKKFVPSEDVTGSQQLKNSVQKGIKAKIIDAMPEVEKIVDDIFPKKENFKLVKLKDHVELIVGHTGDVLFIKHRDYNYIPTLRLLHKYPFILPHQQVDKGAIKFILNGSNIMCPGLTSPGGKITEGLDKGTITAIMAEGKEHALAIGCMKMSSEEIVKKNNDIGIDTIHYLNDGLWKLVTA